MQAGKFPDQGRKSHQADVGCSHQCSWSDQNSYRDSNSFSGFIETSHSHVTLQRSSWCWWLWIFGIIFSLSGRRGEIFWTCYRTVEFHKKRERTLPDGVSGTVW